MKRDELLEKIKEKTKQDARNQLDPRYQQTMGFLVAKGFLRTNLKVQKLPNQRIKLEDAIWAGKNVEPRILEVLPAAVLRLEKHFDLDFKKHKELFKVVDQLRAGLTDGDTFCENPYQKIRAWVNLPLQDRRTKTLGEKKVMKTFRLSPRAIKELEQIASKTGISLTEALEKKIFT